MRLAYDGSLTSRHTKPPSLHPRYACLDKGLCKPSWLTSRHAKPPFFSFPICVSPQVPYLTSFVWNRGGGPKTLMAVTFLSMFVPLPLLHMTKYLSYDPGVNPLIKYRQQYSAVPNEPEGDEPALGGPPDPAHKQ